jgi:hypothetical protein
MRIFCFLFFVVFITSCDPPYVGDNPYMPSKGALVNEVTNKTLVQLKKEKELYPCGIGSGMMHQIRMLAIGFRYYKEVDIDKARELLMEAGTLYLNTINAKEQIRPFLQNYPFQPSNIEIRIFLQKTNGSEPDPGKLTVVSLLKGRLRYKAASHESQWFDILLEETFEEAAAKLGIVEENGQYRRATQVARS